MKRLFFGAALIASLCLSCALITFPQTAVNLEVSFDLNYDGAPTPPPSETVKKGAKATRPSPDPARVGYVFSGWCSDSAGLSLWDFASDAVNEDVTLYAKWTELSPPVPGQIDSLEFGHTSLSPDYCAPMDLPADFGDGLLFSVWTRIPQTLVPPDSLNEYNSPPKLRGNMNVLYLSGENWNLITIVGNIDGYPDGYALYNANFMLDAGNGAWAGDYCTYMTFERDKEDFPLSTVNDWVWVAWQVVVNDDHTMTMRQWLKFGMDGDVFPAGNFYLPNDVWTPLDPEGEEIARIDGWNPSRPTSFRLGYDNTYSSNLPGTLPNSYLTHARLEARTTKPTLNDLEAIATADAPDGTAWGDWELAWRDGAADLSDRSGHGNDLSVMPGGTLHQGVRSPVF